MNELNTVIDGYSVCLMIDSDTTQCYIEKGHASGSLDLALDQGILSTDAGDVHISPKVVDKIEAWAVSHGY